MTAQSIDFLTVVRDDGSTWTRLDRLTDGRIMCQLCFGYFPLADLNPVDGGVEDVCQPCAIADRNAAAIARAVCPLCQVPPGTLCHLDGHPLPYPEVHPARLAEAEVTT